MRWARPGGEGAGGGGKKQRQVDMPDEVGQARGEGAGRGGRKEGQAEFWVRWRGARRVGRW